MFDSLRFSLSEFVKGLRGVGEISPDLELEPFWGFIVRRAGKFVAAVQWDQVCEISAYRCAGSSRDSVVLVLSLKGDPPEIQINEESPAWEPLIAAMIESFPSIPSNWIETLEAPPSVSGDPQRAVLFQSA